MKPAKADKVLRRPAAGKLQSGGIMAPSVKAKQARTVKRAPTATKCTSLPSLCCETAIPPPPPKLRCRCKCRSHLTDGPGPCPGRCSLTKHSEQRTTLFYNYRWPGHLCEECFSKEWTGGGLSMRPMLQAARYVPKRGDIY